MKFLELSGTPFDIGKQHGEQAKEEIHISLDSYERLFYKWGKFRWKDAAEKAKQYIQYIEKVDVAFLEEIDGIAKGASVDYSDILILNARSEIALTLPNTLDGCTSVAALQPFANSTYLAQNWDWRGAQFNATIGLRIVQKNRPTIQMITEAGIIGKIGFNAKGLGVCLNAIRATVAKNYLPLHLGLRLVLNSETVEEASERVTKNKIASAANFLMAQDDGKSKSTAINMEVSPLGNDSKRTTNRYVYHTNHLCSKAIIEKIGQSNLSTTENTYLRFDRMKQLLQEQDKKGVPATSDDIRRWLADHDNKPFSICRHKEPGSSDYTNSVTIFSVIMDLRKKEMLYLDGQPCSPILEKVLTL